MGDEKYAKLEAGLAQFVSEFSEKRKGEQSQEVYEALDVLGSLGDFAVFKKIMLAKKSELAAAGGSGGLKIIDKGIITVDTIPEFMERLAVLKQDADAADGWNQLLDTE